MSSHDTLLSGAEMCILAAAIRHLCLYKKSAKFPKKPSSAWFRSSEIHEILRDNRGVNVGVDEDVGTMLALGLRQLRNPNLMPDSKSRVGQVFTGGTLFRLARKGYFFQRTYDKWPKYRYALTEFGALQIINYYPFLIGEYNVSRF